MQSHIAPSHGNAHQEEPDLGALRDELNRLWESGAYLAAGALLPRVDACGDVELQLEGARIRRHLGGRRPSDAKILWLWRHNREHSRARLEMVRVAATRQGPYRAWKLLTSLNEPAPGDPYLGEWLSLHAYTLALLRDFDQARVLWERAVQAAPQDPWLRVEWAYACEACDKYEEAIAFAQEALSLRPGYRGGIQLLSHLYTLVGREADAVALLKEGLAHCQSAMLAMALFDLQMELGEFEQADETLQLCRAWLPLADREMSQWLSARDADVALRTGELARARETAKSVRGPFYQALARRLEDSAAAQRRVELPVGFVRQHFNTCAPATLSALSHFWNRPAEHLEVAEAICYDGTPAHSERRWARERGFLVREFTVNWDVARQLLDRDIPFTLTTVSTASAHLQAVIGYDELRRSLLIRDPFKRTYNEFDADALWESHRSVGPRGMLLLPTEQEHRLAGIELPDCELWDDYDEVMACLSRHEREAAVAAAVRTEKRDSSHRLSVAAQSAIASYDRNDAQTLSLAERLLSLYPEDKNLKLVKARALSVLSGRDACVQWWNQLAQDSRYDAALAVQHAEFLAADGRQHRETFKLLERALCLNPQLGDAWRLLANLHWQAGRREEALCHYRIAACVEPTNEGLAETYARACRFLAQGEQGLEFLRMRVRTLGDRSGYPAITLFEQLDEMHRGAEGFEVLSKALGRRPNDGNLLLFAAEAALNNARREDGERWLDAAQPLAKRSAWLRLKALHCRELQDFALALELARQACEMEPLNVGLQRLVAQLIAQTQGSQAAVAHLQCVAQQHAHHFEIQRLLLAWLPNEHVEEAIAQLRHMLSINPVDAWTNRELAIKLAQRQCFDEAHDSAQQAVQLAPNQAESHATLGYVLLRQGREAEARRNLMHALTLSVDNDYAANTLLGISKSIEERREALALLRRELLRQLAAGDGLMSYQELARGVIEEEELLQQLRQAWAERSDQWQAWVALAWQLNRMQQFDESLRLLERAVESYPLLPRLHVELAKTQLLLGQRDEARASLQRALQLSPGWAWTVRTYVETVMDERTGWKRALDVLEPALRRNPENGDLRGLRGWVRLQMGARDEAMADLQAALTLDPGLRWVWDVLRDVARESGNEALVSKAAEELVNSRPGDALAWLRLAEFASDPARAHEAVEQGLRLEPRNVPLHEERARQMLATGRYDELAQLLKQTPWGDDPPVAIQAWGARLLRRRGETDAAHEAMRKLLERDPGNFPLWRELADWQDQAEKNAQYVESARHMVRLFPLAAMAHGYMGHALVKMGERTQAAPALRRALELDISYSFAGVLLADVEIELGALEKAEQALAILEKGGATPATALRRLRIAVRQRDRTTGLAQAALITGDPKASAELCKLAVDALSGADWVVWFLDKIEEQIAAGWCGEAAVMLWLSHQGGGLPPGSWYRDVRKALQRDPGHVLKRGVLNWFAEKTGERRLLTRFLRDWRDALQSDPDCLGLGGYALLSQNRDADCAEWLRRWREQPLAAWGLSNLVVALHRLERHDEAAQVAQRMAQLEPGDMQARMWLAFTATLDDRLADLHELLSGIDSSEIKMYWRHLVTLMRAYLEASRAADARVALPKLVNLDLAEALTRKLLRIVAARLLSRYTPAWARPWRWLQFRMGWG